MIEAGRVAVNGKSIDSPALNVSDADRITRWTASRSPRSGALGCGLYHKPTGLVTTAEGTKKGRETVFRRAARGDAAGE